MMLARAIFVAASVASVIAKNVVITVGANDTNTFDPQRVDAKAGDVVVFKFIAGNHSATQSDFASPCIPVHTTNTSINGFDSGLRIGTNGSSGTDLMIPIDSSNNETAIWFYDAFPGACGAGNVGVINSNETSDDNIAAFMRNAQRLNGTDSSPGDNSSSSNIPTSVSAPHSTQSSSSENQATHIVISIVPIGTIALMTFIGILI